jgi:hypothetical protein
LAQRQRREQRAAEAAAGTAGSACVCECVCTHACVRACVRECVCMRACVCARKHACVGARARRARARVCARVADCPRMDVCSASMCARAHAGSGCLHGAQPMADRLGACQGDIAPHASQHFIRHGYGTAHARRMSCDMGALHDTLTLHNTCALRDTCAVGRGPPGIPQVVSLSIGDAADFGCVAPCCVRCVHHARRPGPARPEEVSRSKLKANERASRARCTPDVSRCLLRVASDGLQVQVEARRRRAVRRMLLVLPCLPAPAPASQLAGSCASSQATLSCSAARRG